MVFGEKLTHRPPLLRRGYPCFSSWCPVVILLEMLVEFCCLKRCKMEWILETPAVVVVAVK